MAGKVQKDQKQFFNEYSDVHTKLVYPNKTIDKYIHKEQYSGFQWLSDSKNILDYGCGTGTSIDRFMAVNKTAPKSYSFIGVDIADKAIKRAKAKYPNYQFHAISNNNLEKVDDESIDAAYIIHVLHHSKDHEKMLKEVHNKLKPNGKLLINDLSSRNLLIKLGRNAFGFMPKFIKSKFTNDLVVNDSIPDKYPVDIEKTIELIEKVGFKIKKIEYGHLFFFLFVWIDNIARISNFEPLRRFYELLIKLENYLLKFKPFQKHAELFYIKAMKENPSKTDQQNLNVPISGNYSDSFNKYVFKQVPKNSYCLDVGCWDGNLGEKLIQEKNCKVDGLDVAPQMLEVAKNRGYKKTFSINLNDSSHNLNEIEDKYDVIIFADLLEHLIDPQKALENFRTKLKKDGKIIISLPNVAFALNRFNLLMGKWNYKEFGTLDKTHLKFFTIETAKDLVKNSGYKLQKVQPYNQFGILEKLKFLTDIAPSLFAYQILLVAKKNEK